MTEKTDLEMKVIESSNIDSIGYDPDTNQLYVRFKGNAVYRYDNVPLNVYFDFLEAKSAGKFLGSKIKGEYAFEKIE